MAALVDTLDSPSAELAVLTKDGFFFGGASPGECESSGRPLIARVANLLSLFTQFWRNFSPRKLTSSV